MKAASRKHTEIIKLLVDAGANVNIVDHQGYSYEQILMEEDKVKESSTNSNPAEAKVALPLETSMKEMMLPEPASVSTVCFRCSRPSLAYSRNYKGDLLCLKCAHPQGRNCTVADVISHNV